jgi:hypothetical protein
MELIVTDFYANDLELKLEDLVNSFRIGQPTEDIILIRFNTKDCYVEIGEGSIFGPELNGPLLEIIPKIWEKRNLLKRVDYERYLAHEHFYRVELVLDLGPGHDSLTSSFFQLKHECVWAIVKDKVFFDTDCLENIEVKSIENGKDISK